MKSIMQLDSVKKALEQVVADSDVNNGTRGMEMFCYYWTHENQYDETRQSLMNEMAKLVLLGRPDEVGMVREQIEKLGKPKIIVEFRLMKEIPLIRGTKTISDGSKLYSIQAENVKSIFIPQDSLAGDLLEYEETQDMSKDANGNDSAIIKLRINKGILDVVGEKLDRNQKVIQSKRVYLTAVSYHALQIVGRMKYNEETAKRRRYGFNEMM